MSAQVVPWRAERVSTLRLHAAQLAATRPDRASGWRALRLRRDWPPSLLRAALLSQVLPAGCCKRAPHDSTTIASSHRVFHPEARRPSQCDLKRFSLGRPRDVTWAGAAIGGASWPPGRAACDTAPCLRLPQATAACVGGGAPARSACRARQAARCPKGTSSESEAAPAAGAPGGGAGCAAAASGSVAACCGCGGGSGGGRASAGGPTA